MKTSGGFLCQPQLSIVNILLAFSEEDFKMKNTRSIVLICIVAAAVIYRVLPHPFNFTPVIAIALFSGAKFMSRSQAILIPLIAMLISDFYLGLHTTMIFTYAALTLIVLSGIALKKINLKQFSLVKSFFLNSIATVFATGVFFIVSNFGVWATTTLYSKTAIGLLECYVAAVPFLENSLTGNLFFSSLFFGGFYLAEQQFSQLQESHF